MTDLHAFLSVRESMAFIPVLAITAALGVLLSLVSTVISLRTRATLRTSRPSSTTAGEDLASLLASQAAAIENLERKVTELSDALRGLTSRAPGHIQHLGMVRYQAFPDVGGDLSFSLAFLDGRQTGVVITSLWSRSECRIYAKPVVEGRSQYPLSEEELRALGQALGQHPLAASDNTHVRIGRRQKS